MSCYSKILEDGAVLTVCTEPLIGFKTIEKRIKERRKIFGKSEADKTLEKSKANLGGKT